MKTIQIKDCAVLEIDHEFDDLPLILAVHLKPWLRTHPFVDCVQDAIAAAAIPHE